MHLKKHATPWEFGGRVRIGRSEIIPVRLLKDHSLPVVVHASHLSDSTMFDELMLWAKMPIPWDIPDPSTTKQLPLSQLKGEFAGFELINNMV